MKLASLIGCVALASLSFGQFSETELTGIDDALYFGNLSLDDLKFPREGVSNVAKMPLIQQGLADPVASSDRLMKLHGSGVRGSVAQILAECLRNGWQVIPAPKPSQSAATLPANVPPKTGAAIAKLADSLAQADFMIREALVTLSPGEMRLLLESLATNALEQPTIKLSFVAGKTVSMPETMVLFSKVDLNKIFSAGLLVTQAAELATEELRSAGEPLSGKMKLNLSGLPIVLAGTGDDLHDEVDARITIDLGGDDRYRGRHGAGVGYSSVVIDLGGNDSVKVVDLSMGASILGVGYAAFLEGDDQFFSGSLSFGSAIGGVATFKKTGGHDRYRSDSLSQGFGMLGCGIALDSGGDDVYELGIFGQGAARTSGIGWLIDRQGKDTYRAGGKVLNSPLFASAHYSFAQGFGMGFREDSGGFEGGVGLLTDSQGDDSYIAETYAQAASYWFGIGSLYDSSGNDTYFAHHYAQASAMHMTSAYLFDLAGDDAYTLRVGAGQAVGHDYGVGVLLDRGGEDIYASRDARPGSGLANGLGMFVDAAGIDRYTTSAGFGRADRNSGSLGVFVDLSGQDVYGIDLGNGAVTLRPELSIAVDQLDQKGQTTVNPANPEMDVKVGSRARPSDSELEALYKRATQWAVGTAESDTKQALNTLVEIGVPALEWMLEKKLRFANRLEIRAFGHVVRALGPAAGIPLGAASIRADELETENLLRIAVESRNLDLAAIIPGVLENRPALRRRAAVAAGVLKVEGAVPALLPLLLDPDKLLVREAMIALELIGSREAIGSAISLMKSEDFLTRRSAAKLIAKFAPDAKVYALARIQESAEAPARQAIELLGLIGDEESLNMIVDALNDPRPGVRISALVALQGRLPESAEAQVRSLLEDPIPAVRMAAKLVIK